MADSSQMVEVLPAVQQFLARSHKLFINGAWVDSAAGRTLPTHDPSNGEAISRVTDADPEDLDRAVAAARNALEGAWGKVRPAERERFLQRFADLIEANGEELAQLETINSGKSIHLSRMLEVGASVEYVRYMSGWATKIEGSTLDLSIPLQPDTHYMGMTLREPVGVVGAIVPWNFPLMMAIWKIAPALACGCTVVLKPSTETPLTALRLAELAKEAGIPDGTLNVVTGRGAGVGAALAGHPGIDKVTFTGSTEIGRQVGMSALSNMTRCSLELGGKNPMIILDDMDPTAILPGLMTGCFINQGQVCVAASRLYIQRGVFDKVVSNLEGAMKSMRMGPGLDAQADLQPLVSSSHRETVDRRVQKALSEGATIVTGGCKANRPGYFFEPTLLLNCNADNTAVKEELFGPVITAIPIDNLEQGIAQANDTRYGLAASIWSNDFGSVMNAVRRLKAGTVWVNAHVLVDPNLPFGGYKESGIGREHGRSMIDLYTETKSVCFPTAR